MRTQYYFVPTSLDIGKRILLSCKECYLQLRLHITKDIKENGLEGARRTDMYYA